MHTKLVDKVFRIILTLMFIAGMSGVSDQNARAQEPNPSISTWDWHGVFGNNWPLGDLVTLTVDDDSDPDNGILHMDTDTSHIAPWDPNTTAVQYEVPFNLQPGYVIMMSNSIITKTMTVVDISVTNVDPIFDTVSGTAPAGMDVNIHLHDGGAKRHTVADGDGNWTADFAHAGTQWDEQDIVDLIPGSSGNAYTPDDDGDSTGINWRVPDPHITAYPAENTVVGEDFPANAVVTLTIDDPSNGSGTDVTLQSPINKIGGRCTGYCVEFSLPEWFHLAGGHLVNLNDGTNIISYTVSNLTVTSVNIPNDTISGTADPYSSIYLTMWLGPGNRHVTADANGGWLADFSVPGSGTDEQGTCDFSNPDQNCDGMIIQWEGDDPLQDNRTRIDWRMPNPRITVRTSDGAIFGGDWPLGATVNLTIDDPNTGPGVDYSDSQVVTGEPSNTHVDFDLVGFDVQPGHIVTFSDGATTKELVVSRLDISTIDTELDRVTGIAEPFGKITVAVHFIGVNSSSPLNVNADQNGDWVADFAGIWDITTDHEVHADEWDEDGDATMDIQGFPPPPEPPFLCEPGTTISGHVLTAIGTTTDGSQVFFKDYNTGEALFYADADENGYYSCTLPEGDYRVRAVSSQYSTEYYENTFYENAAPIHVTATTELAGINFSLDTPWGWIDQFTFNFADPVINDLAVRQAIAYGTDLVRIITAQQDTHHAIPAGSYLNPQHWAFPTTGLPQYDYNPGLAAGILDNAGWIDTDEDGVREKNGVRLHFTYLFRETAAWRHITAAIFAENMAEIGVEVEILPLPLPDWYQRVYVERNFGIAQFGWGIDNGFDQGSGNYLGWNYHSADEWGVNLGSYSNPFADQLLEDALAFNTRAELLPYYQQHQILVMTDLAVFPLFMWDDSDMDGDGIGDWADNARFTFNPDQRDVDGDGVADVLDPCSADASDACDPDGSAAAAIGPDGGTLATANGNVSIQVPAGALPDYISLSITDDGNGYLVSTDQGQIEAVVAVDIEPSGTTFDPAITITFHWQDSDNDGKVDGTNLKESKLVISKDGLVIAGPCSSDPNCDTTANTLAVQVSSLSFFVLGAPPNQPPVADAGGPYTVAWGMTLTLDGSGSTDPDGDLLIYEWDLDNDGYYDDASGVSPTATFNHSGEHTIGLLVTDKGDLRGTETTTVTVLPWTLNGFYSPVDMNGVFNVVKNGSTVPFKFEIFAGSTELTDIIAIQSFRYATIACDASAVFDEIEIVATDGTLLRYDLIDGQFIYNWKTPRTAGTCYRVSMTTQDGSSLVAFFKLK